MVNNIELKKNTYSSAKISVRRRTLYGIDKIKELTKYEFDEILRYLEEHGFRKSVDKAYLQYDGFYLVERVLNDHLSEIYKSVFLGFSGKNKVLLETYYLKYQVHNFMALLRCKKAKENDFEAYLIGSPRRKEKFLKAWEMPIEDGIIYISKKLGFEPDEVLENYRKGIYEVENYLYRIYYEKLRSIGFAYNNKDEKIFVSFIQQYIDLLNARSYLRLRNESESKISFEEFFLKGGKLPIEKFKELDSKSLNQVLEFLRDFLKKDEFSFDTLSIASIDRTISAHKKNAYNIFKGVKFGSPFYSLRYLFEVEREMNLLRVVLKAKYLKMSREETLKLIE